MRSTTIIIIIVFTVLLLDLSSPVQEVAGFTASKSNSITLPSTTSNRQIINCMTRHRHPCSRRTATTNDRGGNSGRSPSSSSSSSSSLSFSLLSSSSTSLSSHTTYETEIAMSTIAFASSHIGMSAIRRDLIDSIGKFADNNGWVGTGLSLPAEIWPGDEAGQDIFPSADIAGRQLYRILYTVVSFVTLGSAFGYYLSSIAADNNEVSIPSTIVPTTLDPNDPITMICYTVASIAGGISITSLFNPSPLSLVPVYEPKQAGDGSSSLATTTTTAPIRRNDSKKLQPKGLTRITRHPLILPVVPWGFATAMIMGGHNRDFFLFGMLSIYAIAGCYAQDLRVIREEGSVGTVFSPSSNQDDDDGKGKGNSSSLQQFFDETSFVPFQAVIESKQSLTDVINEVPWWALVGGTVVAYQIEKSFIMFLVDR